MLLDVTVLKLAQEELHLYCKICHYGFPSSSARVAEIECTPVERGNCCDKYTGRVQY
jgi:hypothetical protein